MATDIRIYQGNRIGGCITVISADAAKIVIDFGESLPGAEIVENIDFDWASENVDAVFFTHYHGDHIGRFMEIPDEVRLYMGEVTWKVLHNLNEALGRKDVTARLENRPNIHFISPRETVVIGDIKVTPYSVDHSAFDAYMFLVETPDKNILHTGDYRDHGHRGHTKKSGNVMLGVICNHIMKGGKRKIDVLITEGTMMGKRGGEKRYSEKQMMQDAEKLFQEHKYVFLKISSTNADSLATFYHAARKNDMGFYANKYVISQLDTFAEAGQKYTTFYDFRVKWQILPRPDENATEEYRDRFNRQRRHMREDGFVMIVSEREYYEEIMDEFADCNPILIYSLWRGYIDEKVGKGAYNPELARFCKKYNAIDMHTSGHAYPNLIKEVINMIGAEKTIIIHKDTEQKLFKDRPIIKHTNEEDLEVSLSMIYEIIQGAQIGGEEYLRDKLLNGKAGKGKHRPTRKGCKGFEEPAVGKIKEKRICKCMFYYMKNPEMCKECNYDNKWKNVGKIQITNYEVPTMYKCTGVGRIDLIFDDEYAVEIKPLDGSESITRMFAEILTYTIDPDYEGKKYKPAICFFKDSQQMAQFKALLDKKNDIMKYIMENIKVFYFETSDINDDLIEYSIHPIEDYLAQTIVM